MFHWSTHNVLSVLIFTSIAVYSSSLSSHYTLIGSHLHNDNKQTNKQNHTHTHTHTHTHKLTQPSILFHNDKCNSIGSAHKMQSASVAILFHAPSFLNLVSRARLTWYNVKLCEGDKAHVVGLHDCKLFIYLFHLFVYSLKAV